MDNLYERLASITRSSKKQGGKSVPLKKFEYQPHPNTAGRSESEINTWRKDHAITCEGHAPNPIFSFDEAPFPTEVIKKLEAEYEQPTPIQSQGWPVALSGRDMIGVSQTGSGKTLGFILPAIQQIQTNIAEHPLGSGDGPIALVVAPTRELVMQIHDETLRFLPGGMRVAGLYGGASKMPQIRDLQNRPHIVIATPGRLMDFLSEGATNFKRTSYVILDEADRMLDMGFEPQVRAILDSVPSERQMLMWSATWPREVQNLAMKYFKDPVTISVGDLELRANPNVEQCFYVCDPGQQMDVLTSMVSEIMKSPNSKILVFSQTKVGVDNIENQLYNAGVKNISTLHGDHNMMLRTRALNSFRAGKARILVATEVAARGLDVSDITDVINAEPPNELDSYIHRIGRTGRAGKKGRAHTIFTGMERHVNAQYMRQIIRLAEEAGHKPPQDLYDLASNKSAEGRGGGFAPRSRYGGGGGGRGFGGRGGGGHSSHEHHHRGAGHRAGGGYFHDR